MLLLLLLLLLLPQSKRSWAAEQDSKFAHQHQHLKNEQEPLSCSRRTKQFVVCTSRSEPQYMNPFNI